MLVGFHSCGLPEKYITGTSACSLNNEVTVLALDKVVEYSGYSSKASRALLRD
jgi:hypothetical protein